MKNLIVFYDPELNTQLQDIPIPEYGDDEVLIRVIVAGSNPKDWKHPAPDYFNIKLNQGDDVAGIVEAAGRKVKNFRKGDRVAGFHVMDTPRGTYAEYTVCPANTVFHIPDTLSFEEAATIPLAAYTAAIGLYRNLRLPLPSDRSDDQAATRRTPLIINAVSGAVGAFAVKLAKLSPSIAPIIGIAGASADFAREIGCDFVIDYRSDDVLGQLQKALGGKEASHVFDANNTIRSTKYLLPILNGENPRLTFTSKGDDPEEQDKLRAESRVWNERIWVGSIHGTDPPGAPSVVDHAKDGAQIFGAVISTLLQWALEEGKLSGQPYTVVRDGLNGVLDALIELRDRKGGNSKFVTRIADTPGI